MIGKNSNHVPKITPEQEEDNIMYVNFNKLMDQVDMSHEEILKLGWQEVKDRGMSENNGHLYYHPSQHWVLRYWEGYPRMELSYKQSVAFDSALTDRETYGRPLDIQLLKDKMTAHAILYPQES